MRLVSDPKVMRKPLAIGLDSRNRDFSTQVVVDLINDLSRKEDVRTDVLFLTCDLKVLLLRFSETRRRHPLSPAETPCVGIEREFSLLSPIQALANVLIDTSELSPHELKEEMQQWFAVGELDKLALTIHSFSYKRGIPRGVDTLIDCRFLNNPYWEPSLRLENGTSAAVQNFLKKDENNYLTHCSLGFDVLFVDGHTEKQMIPIINFKGQKIAFAADLIPTAGHVPLPYIPGYDIRPLTSLKEKESFLNFCIDNSVLLFFEHDADEELGLVQK